MGLTSKFVKSQKPSLTEGLMHLLDKGVTLMNEREQEKRDHTYFHISSIGYCLKSTYLTAKHGKDQDMSFLRKVNFGSKLHELYQKYFACSGHIYGNWYCKRCNTITAAGFEPKECECKDRSKFEYSEFHFMNAKYKVSGHPDGFLKLHKPKLTLLEIKTISQFYQIKKGSYQVEKHVPEHKRQCNFYLHIMQDKSTLIKGADKDMFLAMLDTSKYCLLYHDKGTDEPVAYEFDADPKQYEEDLARVQLYHKCAKEGKEPPAEPSTKGCKYCSFVNQCNGVGGAE